MQSKTNNRTLNDAIKGADVFLVCQNKEYSQKKWLKKCKIQ